MPVVYSVTLDGIAGLRDALERLPPRSNPSWVGRALVRAALRVQQIASEEKILRGGKGPPVPDILTSRTGTLRRSIRVDRAGVPFFIETGTDLLYGLVHEVGGRFHPKRPFILPALDDALVEMERIFTDEWERAV